tara:strand:- start:4309 stop:4536 length:228 start_codon:yes stop_codon:yes gene_type:complete
MGEGRKHVGNMVVGNHPVSALVGSLIVTIISLLILLLVGEYLWNNVLVKVTTGIKPVTSVWQILGIVVLAKLIFC